MNTPSQSMAMSQTQRLQMVLAPQLRQSLEMLQLPILELRTLLQQEMEQNPTIEESPSQDEPIEIEPGASQPDATEPESEKKEPLDFDKEIEALAKLDDEWRDYFLQDRASNPRTDEQEEKRQFFLDSLAQRESLQQHLMGQLNLSGLSEDDRKIAELIIGSINDDGYLTNTIAELAANTGHDQRHMEDVLAVVHDFHPVGVGSRDPRECLSLQLERMGIQDGTAVAIVRDHLEELGARKFQDIAKALKITPQAVQQAAVLIGTLDPKPGRAYSAEVAAYILPEVQVLKVDGRYVVVLNDDQLPHVRISSHYRRLLEDPATTPDVRSYVQDKIRSGAFLIKSIHQRQRTIHRIATEIVTAQTDFLGHGIARLRPLTMAEVAGIVGVHETTVSRAVSGKYMQTPIGTFEMKFFFTPGIRTTDGKEVSNKTVQDMIASLVAREEPTTPLSDQEIVEKLREQGVTIARRTIAKYRLVMRISPSHLRKSY
jgi:RNA polymerase sigma-54 factor